jgi:sialate O-acetylesterase
MKKYAIIFIVTFITFNSFAQDETLWHKKKCAVVLTYDDAINQHLDNAIPILDSLKLKATFYVTAFSKSLQTRLNEWRKLSKNGHELGNHTLFHPCIGGKEREWVKPEYDMNNYTLQRMIDETRMTNIFLQALDGKTKRTFAFTCGDMKIGDSSFINQMKNDFVAARAVRNEMHTIDKIDLYNVDCYMVNNNTAEEMIGWVKKAVETNSLLVILFHGVGGGNGLNVSLPNHRKFLFYLKQNEKDIWITPMIEVAEYIKKHELKYKTR